MPNTGTGAVINRDPSCGNQVKAQQSLYSSTLWRDAYDNEGQRCQGRDGWS